MGGMLGSLSSASATQLGATAISDALAKSGLDNNQIDEVLMGCVLSAGVGQAPARQAAIGAGLDRSSACTTINKVCGSAMKAVMMAANALRAGQSKAIVAGGMESMSRAPYLIPQGRQGYRFGHAQMLGSYAVSTACKMPIRATRWEFLPRPVRRNITLVAKIRMPMPLNHCVVPTSYR